ncbi:hypothetical protein SPRG_19092 [Saprolegnia parasitica CBS 223.65]|uniref:Peptidase M24 domain-containing protein n=1 Tax=Saprolegnia parasitica (strain CBS 223.65) TaxID=695850 RepID=A0A067D6H7_SAPPC|nr:hypothetical protein SPRG_19092 [Saprolegnia parasitica CBS 223.65]KDO34271.1 hypothetical protein SPRG_19092 [Saprolegnia parasitica CBS 223.65]|eukprot:XP_012195288.1 hypothetical protein SPRG_19092 [Saprolegnia parasitica CBS 223.65]
MATYAAPYDEGVDVCERVEDFGLKVERVRALLRDLDVNGCLLSLSHNFAWLSGGGRNHILLASEGGVGSLFVNATRVLLITNNIEGQRLLHEELAGLPIELLEEPWYESRETEAVLAAIVGPGATFLRDTNTAVEKRLAQLRQSLTPLDIKRYRALGRHCSHVVTSVADSVRRGDAEWSLAGQLHQRALEHGIDAVVVLVAADERLDSIRHPLPTTKLVREKVMLVLCGRRGGLICSLTRIVCVAPKVPEDLRARHHAVTFVDATALAATRPGAIASDIFRAIQNAYAISGYPNEWKRHHQGGGTGYKSREWKADASNHEIVAPLGAFAWNPSIAGTKSEDTVLLLAEGQLEVLTQAPMSWPMLRHVVDGIEIARPDILHRPS